MSETARNGQEVALPPLAVLVVNWNGRDVLPDCLRSLAESRYPGLRLLMVDNASGDGSVAWVRAHHPQVEIVQTGANLRWAGGNNVGLRHLAATGWRGLVLLLNNDTVVPEGSLGRLAGAVVLRSEAWAATPRICYASDPARAWYDGGLVGPWTGWVRHAGIRKLTGRLRNEEHFVGWGTGCALLLTPRALQVIGELDEHFHFYGEDTDYSLRIRRAGGRILHVPRALVLHKVSASVGGGTSPRKAWLRSRSHVRLLRKHWRRWTWPLLIPCQLAFLTGHACWHLWQGRPTTALAVWQGVLDELTDRPYAAG
ncbi:MAG: glycosyltransferase family 2 protein [Candidatus Krumholzibacteriia bacterium]